MRVLVLHGPNLNLTGVRETAIYGAVSLAEINSGLIEQGAALGLDVECFQSNHEGDLIDKIQEAGRCCDLIIINPGALTHYSFAIHDALRAAALPAIEVHMSNIHAREEWRRLSVIAPAASGQIAGFGRWSYTLALAAAGYLLGSAPKGIPPSGMSAASRGRPAPGMSAASKGRPVPGRTEGRSRN